MQLTSENYLILASIFLIGIVLAVVITYWVVKEEPKPVSRPRSFGKQTVNERERFARSQTTNGHIETFYERASEAEKKIIHSIIARLKPREYPDNFYHSARNKTPEGRVLFSLSYIRIAVGFKKSYYYYCHFVNP